MPKKTLNTRGAQSIPWYKENPFWGGTGLFFTFFLAGLGFGLTGNPVLGRVLLWLALPWGIIALWSTRKSLSGTARRASYLIGGSAILSCVVGLPQMFMITSRPVVPLQQQNQSDARNTSVKAMDDEHHDAGVGPGAAVLPATIIVGTVSGSSGQTVDLAVTFQTGLRKAPCSVQFDLEVPPELAYMSFSPGPAAIQSNHYVVASAGHLLPVHIVRVLAGWRDAPQPWDPCNPWLQDINNRSSRSSHYKSF